MPNGHRSHQSGLDVDIWFLQPPRGIAYSQKRTEVEQVEMVSMVRAGDGELNDARWSPRYRDALKQAGWPEVERIFVNRSSNKTLCARETDRSWLYKLRPWWGHDAHFSRPAGLPARLRSMYTAKPIRSMTVATPIWPVGLRDIVQAALAPRPYRKARPPSTRQAAGLRFCAGKIPPPSDKPVSRRAMPRSATWSLFRFVPNFPAPPS